MDGNSELPIGKWITMSNHLEKGSDSRSHKSLLEMIPKIPSYPTECVAQQSVLEAGFSDASPNSISAGFKIPRRAEKMAAGWRFRARRLLPPPIAEGSLRAVGTVDVRDLLWRVVGALSAR